MTSCPKLIRIQISGRGSSKSLTPPAARNCSSHKFLKKQNRSERTKLLGLGFSMSDSLLLAGVVFVCAVSCEASLGHCVEGEGDSSKYAFPTNPHTYRYCGLACIVTLHGLVTSNGLKLVLSFYIILLSWQFMHFPVLIWVILLGCFKRPTS